VASFADFPKIIGYDADRVPARRRDEVEAWFERMRAILAKVKLIERVEILDCASVAAAQ
jgi:hypothetical protein